MVESKWDTPSLEEMAASYTGEDPLIVHWRGKEFNEKEFALELAPEYLEAAAEKEYASIAVLESVIDTYLRQILLLNLLINYYDIGEF